MTRLEELERANPEWGPWLSVLARVVAADAQPWRRSIPCCFNERHPAAPLLAGCVLEVDGMAAAGLLEKLLHAAGCTGQGVDASAARDLFHAALNRDDARLKARASAAQADPEAYRAIAALLPQPFLRACNAQLSGVLPKAWPFGYCPLCGAWAAFAEICGVERARYLRCPECGSAWRMHGLACTYCGLTKHEDLGSLVPEGPAVKASLEICRRCRGYLKAFRRLSVCPSADVMLEDLASVELDLVALERGFRRPERPGHALGVRMKDAR
jgi:FdhE protein